MSELVHLDLAGRRLRQLQILEFLYDHLEARGIEIAFGPLYEQIDRDEVQATVPALVEQGYIMSEPDLSGYSGAFLLPPGDDVVEQVREHRDNASERSLAARDKVLYWLHEQGPGAQPALSKFLESKYNRFYGGQFTDADINHSSQWLKEEGYLTGAGAWGAGVLRPKITTKGDRVVENGRSVNDPPDAAGDHYTATIHGNATNFVMGSSHFTQNSQVNQEVVEGLPETVEAVRQMFELLVNDGVDPADLSRALNEAEAVDTATSGADVFRSTLEKLKSTVAVGVGSAVGGVIVSRINTLLAMIPN